MKRQFVQGLALLSIVAMAAGCREGGTSSRRVFANPPPLVTSLTSSTNTNGFPSVTGNGTGNSTFQLQGSNLGAVVQVLVGGVEASFTLNAGGDTMTVTVPNNVPGGTQSVQLITAGNNSVPAGSVLVLAQTHVLITEIGNGGGTNNDFEFVEIFNPTGSNINLATTYLTDGTNTTSGDFYYNLAQDLPAGENNSWSGFSTDFLVRFPNVNIAPGQYLTVSIHDAADGGTAGGNGGNPFYFDNYGRNPNFEIVNGGDGDSIADMLDLRNSNGFTSSSIGTSAGFTSSSGELCVMFSWDGTNPLVQDVDYIIFGDAATSTVPEAVTKTNVTIMNSAGSATFRPETALVNQRSLGGGTNPSLGGVPLTDQRIALNELGENLTSGNGTTGHDETSENLPASFQQLLPASPGLPYPANPRAGETGVARDLTVRFQFYRPVSTNTPVDNTRMSLTTGGNQVAGNVTFDIATNTAIFTPDATLMANTTYTVTLDSSIQRNDNFFFFLSNFNYQFTTGN